MSDARTETEQKSTSWKDKTLKAAGAGYMLGDAAMAAAGIARGKEVLGTIGGATTWFAGGLAAHRYGNPDIDKQLELQASKLEHYLKQKGVSIPDDVRAQSALLKNKTVWQKVEQFMYEHPSELLNGTYALGSAMLLHESITKDMAKEGELIFPRGLNKPSFQKVSTTFWIAILVGTGALLGLFVKEDPKARAHEDASAGIVERAVNFVKEQPLRASAALYTVNNGFLAFKAFQDFNEREGKYASKTFKPHYASGLQLAAYLFSNLMLFISPRNQITKRGFAAEDMAKLEQAAAAIIAAQPAQAQQAVLADVSEFMATQKGVSLKAPEIAQHLASRVTELTAGRMQAAATQVKNFAQVEEARRADRSVAAPHISP